ncbi:unnamed protein product [Camellia sinensis]
MIQNHACSYSYFQSADPLPARVYERVSLQRLRSAVAHPTTEIKKKKKIKISLKIPPVASYYITQLYFTQPRTKPSSSTESTLPGEQSPRRHRRRPVPQMAPAERRNLFPRF